MPNCQSAEGFAHMCFIKYVLLDSFFTLRKWTKELDDAIDELQQNMEMECNKYFEEIMPKAIKVSVSTG